ncbi:MAG: hypothetical protein ACOC07_18190, partial [Coleofasciculus sp.]|uniref:hypothetical protein n=1 Tax=Coleofasciculus sp. TaxID=3100458 RepID=UPI003A133218
RVEFESLSDRMRSRVGNSDAIEVKGDPIQLNGWVVFIDAGGSPRQNRRLVFVQIHRYESCLNICQMWVLKR